MQLILGRLEKERLLHKTDNKQIWILNNVHSGEKYVGKFQSKSKLDKVNVKNVLHEASFLQQLQGHSAIPSMYWSGVQGIEIVVILQYLGYSIQQRLNQCGGKFSLKTTCLLGIRILNCLRNLHEKGVIHRNLSSKSIQFGRGFKSSQIYFSDLIDCKKFRNKKTYSHIAFKKGVKYTFQNIYGSNRFHRNEEISRIDDIQNMINILIYLMTGTKPNQKGQFVGVEIPAFLTEMKQYSMRFQFHQQPNYQWFNQKLLSTLFHYSFEDDEIFDWMLKPQRFELLRVPKTIISLKLDQDEDILAQIYYPYSETIEVDEVSEKYHRFNGQALHKLSESGAQIKKSVQLEQKLKKRKSINSDKQKKGDCLMM